ncbi:hypothetical protein PVAP13_4KG096466 [Panicum virgatum]|uniref:Uncharacterized protein n=1 Tax=Panicum virgatum TaxID=38727 RepID=A0A8T0TEG0_PANVG|nr:hypothetical protein PVAP13_4KG096466 [Panicum virgatum]
MHATSRTGSVGIRESRQDRRTCGLGRTYVVGASSRHGVGSRLQTRPIRHLVPPAGFGIVACAPYVRCARDSSHQHLASITTLPAAACLRRAGIVDVARRLGTGAAAAPTAARRSPSPPPPPPVPLPTPRQISRATAPPPRPRSWRSAGAGTTRRSAGAAARR